MEIISIITAVVSVGSLLVSFFAFRRNMKKIDEDKRNDLNKEVADLKIRMSVTEERCKGRGCVTSALLTQIDSKLDEIEDNLK